jgi:hypothetical protein
MFRPLVLPEAPALNDNSGFEPARTHPFKRGLWSDTHLKYPIELLLEDSRMWQIMGVEHKRIMLSVDHSRLILSIKDMSGATVAEGTHQFWIKRHPGDQSGGFVRLFLRYDRGDHWFQLNHAWHPMWRPITALTSKFKYDERDVFLTLVSAGGSS